MTTLRSRRHRRRPGRLCLRHPRGASSACKVAVRREARDPWRHLPQCRLHSLEGAARMRARPIAEAAHDFAAMGIKVKPELDLAAMLAFKDKGVKGNVDGVEFLLKKNKIDAFHGTGRITAPAHGRGRGRQGQDASPRDQGHRHRHRLGGGACARHRHRREAHRVLDRRARAFESAEAHGGDRRRLYRPRTRLGVVAPRRGGHRGRDARTASRPASTASLPSSCSASSRSRA